MNCGSTSKISSTVPGTDRLGSSLLHFERLAISRSFRKQLPQLHWGYQVRAIGTGDQLYLVQIDSFLHYCPLKDLKYADSYSNNFRNFTACTRYGRSGIQLSTGTIMNILKDAAAKALIPVRFIKDELLEAKLIHFDETGISVNKHTHWVHNASNRRFNFMTVNEKRGKEGMDANGVLPQFRGIAIHDFWASYFKYDAVIHGMCGAHLLRELRGVTENHPDQTWASDLTEWMIHKKSLKEQAMCRGEQELNSNMLHHYMVEYDSIVAEGLGMNPVVQKTEVKRGRVKKGKTRALLERFETYKGEVCLFIHDFKVPFDNNQAERDIRMIKVKNKVSGTFRTKEGAVDFMSLMSFVGTCRKNGIVVFEALKALHKGEAMRLLIAATE